MKEKVGEMIGPGFQPGPGECQGPRKTGQGNVEPHPRMEEYRREGGKVQGPKRAVLEDVIAVVPIQERILDDRVEGEEGPEDRRETQDARPGKGLDLGWFFRGSRQGRKEGVPPFLP